MPGSPVSDRGSKATGMVSDRRTAERTILVTVVLGAMLAPLNSTMITVALPTLLGDFGRSLVWGSWIVASYLVAMAAFQPLSGSLGDRYGRRRLFLIGLMLFLVATVVAALSWSIEVLIAARRERVVRGHGVGVVARRPGVDAQHLAQQLPGVLGPAARVPGAAAVAEAEVEQAVGPEDDVAPVVVGEGLVDRQHPAAGPLVDVADPRPRRPLVDVAVPS